MSFDLDHYGEELAEESIELKGIRDSYIGIWNEDNKDEEEPISEDIAIT